MGFYRGLARAEQSVQWTDGGSHDLEALGKMITAIWGLTRGYFQSESATFLSLLFVCPLSLTLLRF